MGANRRARWTRVTDPASPVIPIELLLFGAWGITAPYLGRAIGLVVDTTSLVEVVDHVIPGAAVLVVAMVAIITGRRWFVTSMVVVAAGMWMTATHLPLLVEAVHGQADMGASLFHMLPGVVILLIGVVASIVDARLEAAARLHGAAQTEHGDAER